MDRVVLERREDERGLLNTELKKTSGIEGNEHSFGQL